jgi:hypothetical protein
MAPNGIGKGDLCQSIIACVAQLANRLIFNSLIVNAVFG